MFLFPVNLRRSLGVLLGVAVAATAHGQTIVVAKASRVQAPAARGADVETSAPAAIHKIVIFEGPNRSVHYVASGNVPVSDTRAALELQNAENELSYIGNLQQLKQQYVNSERTMEPLRRVVQEQLFGAQITYGGSSTGYGGYGGGGGYYPYAFGSYGNRGGGFSNSSGYSVTRSLAVGMGDEGRFKDAMVQVMALQSSPEYTASVLRNYDNAVARAGSAPTLAKALSLPKSDVRPVGFETPHAKGAKLTLTLKDKEKISGTVESEDAEWIVLRTATNRVTVRKAEVLRYEEPLTPPAPGK